VTGEDLARAPASCGSICAASSMPPPLSNDRLSILCLPPAFIPSKSMRRRRL